MVRRIVFFLASLLLSTAASAEPQLILDSSISYQVAVYQFPGSNKQSKNLTEELLKKNHPDFKVVEKLSENIKQPEIALYAVSEVQKKYPPPDMQMIGYFGRGLSREQAENIQKSEHVLILNIAYPAKERWKHHHEVQNLILDIAEQTNGLIWDEETREIFSVEAWKERRVYDMNKGAPRIDNHTVIHAYNTGEYVRAVSLGMGKFGLPDVAVNDFPWSLNRSMGNLINISMQLMAEGLSPDKSNYLVLDITRIKNNAYREEMLESLKDNSEKSALIQVQGVQPEEGDPHNRIYELVFENRSGVPKHQYQEAILSELFGSEDSITYVKHNEKILEASQQAKNKLPGLKADFNDGLEPGEYIHVKAPFATPGGGNEWMWVEVITWKGERIQGLLKNEPFNIPGLKAGAEVQVRQSEIFDYIRYFADGTREGNETGKLIMKYSQ